MAFRDLLRENASQKKHLAIVQAIALHKMRTGGRTPENEDEMIGFQQAVNTSLGLKPKDILGLHLVSAWLIDEGIPESVEAEMIERLRRLD